MPGREVGLDCNLNIGVTAAAFKLPSPSSQRQTWVVLRSWLLRIRQQGTLGVWMSSEILTSVLLDAYPDVALLDRTVGARRGGGEAK